MKYRNDIDGLRALAVLAVVMFHAFPGVLKGGFIGVDVFFVISGFLISSIIIKDIEQDEFSWKTFYDKRIRRIVPMLLVVLASTVGMAFMFLDSGGLVSVFKHVVGASLFSSNLLLWSETGYFDKAAAFKPLLHLWSLGVEEQFYLVWPWVLILLRKRSKFTIFGTMITLGMASFAYDVALIASNDTSAAFYNPLARFWEMAVGSLLAYALHFQGIKGGFLRSKWTSRGALLALGCGMVFMSEKLIYPGIWALVPVLLTALLIAAGSQGNTSPLLSHPKVVWVGKMSYGWYLWHWPLMVFTRIAYHGEPSWWMMGSMVPASLMLAWMSTRWIENPIRFSQDVQASKKLVLLMLMGVGFGMVNAQSSWINLSKGMSPEERTKSMECAQENGFIQGCDGDIRSAKTYILGDSHAEHLLDGMSKMDPFHVQNCPSYPGLVFELEKNGSGYDCTSNLNFIDQHLNLIRKNKDHIDRVIISNHWYLALNGEIRQESSKSFYGAQRLVSKTPMIAQGNNQDMLVKSVSSLIDQLEQWKLPVIIVRSNPDMRQDPQIVCLGLNDCYLPQSTFDKERDQEERFLMKIKKAHPQVVVVDPFEKLCDGGRCYFVKNGQSLYKDGDHLSINGSALVGEQILKNSKQAVVN